MRTPTARAGYLRGGLVGVCSALVTALAHSVAGGATPTGATLMFLMIVCVTVGIVLGAVNTDGRYTRIGLVVGALAIGQVSGHMVLTLTSEQHGECGWMLTAPMLSVHVAAALALGIAISAVEHLYAVCGSILRWLRLFSITQLRPMVRLARAHAANVVVVRPVLLLSGLGMRAPPPLAFVGA